MLSYRSLALGCSLALVVSVAACAAGKATATAGVGGGGDGGAGGATSTSTSTSTASSSSSSGNTGGFTSSSSTGGSGSGVLYVHTNKTLYELDPMSPANAPTVVGDFDCIGGQGQESTMTDLAVSSAGDLWGISATSVYKLEVQGSAVHCALTLPLKNAKGVSFYALTFAPVGVLDPNQEVLIAGNSAGELWAIDGQGNATLHGNFGNVPKNDGHGHSYPAKNQGKRWELSGDIVFLENKGNPIGFATVRDCPNPPADSNCGTTDTLIQIDMAALKTATTGSVTKSVRGQTVAKAGCSGGPWGRMYGIAAFEDKVFGFSHNGDIVEIDNTDGGACLIQSNAMSYWDGAGVTTVAPIIEPK